MDTDKSLHRSSAEALVVEGLHKSFGNEEVLRGVSLLANEGDVLSIIGASGSGKSTLLRCINLLEQPSSGEIRIGGEQILFTTRRGHRVPADMKQVQRLRTRLGMVFQSFNLWSHMTVQQNVMEVPRHVLGVSKTEAAERAEHYLNRVGLWDKREQYPAYLSGGQQQRAAIARALAIQPRVMLFDEPTSALDPELVGEVLKVIHDLANEGRTMILVTHEMKFARDVSTQVIFLHQGLVEESGSPRQVFYEPVSDRCRAFVSSIH
ncbi:MAG: ATP-binding cassette domain-containing protein [Granulosicoccus sp.]|nr:ATP-binding cassette domain-containing protein [Granulosicoccus sp.]